MAVNRMPGLTSLRLGLLLFCFSSTALAEQGDWPYSTPIKPEVPEVKSQAWISNDIDAFILEKLEASDLTPSHRASKSQLVRRLYLDLIGLPPTPAEIEEVLEDSSGDAIAKLIDKLLEDPRYGEHWARYWLDLARYADTAGYEGDPDLPHAWRYRDYVIDSLNRDKPYDRFILEQIAGDELQDILGAGELPNVDPELLIAMTFLRLAPFTEPRGDESRHELLSEMTSTVSSVFLGLTVGCAKCHDHMHDPVPTEDFYRLKAFFSTVQIPPPLRGDGFQIGGPTPAGFYRSGEAEQIAGRERRLREDALHASEKLQILTQELESRLELHAGFGIQAMGGGFGNDYVFDRRTVTDNRPHMTVVSASASQWQYFTDGRISSAQGSLAGTNRGHWFDGLENPSYLSMGFATDGTGDARTASFDGSIAHFMVFGRPLTEEESRLSPGELAKLGDLRVWFDAADIDANPETENPEIGARISVWKDKVSGIEIRQNDVQSQPELQMLPGTDAFAIKFSDSFLVGSLSDEAFLSDASGAIVTRFSSQDDDEAYLVEVGGDQQFIATFVNPAAGSSGALEAIIADDADQRVSREEREQFRGWTNFEKFLPQQLKRLQPMAMTLRHSFGPPYEPGVPTSRVLIRGEWDNPGKAVEPGFPSAIVGHSEAAAIRLDPFKRWPTRGRRKALADWIASSENPLTARVIVNRLWYRHFGRGIVETPSDFGSLSGGPSHEALLDFLAITLVERDWSLKAIHRLICNSATYQQSSETVNQLAVSEDPENKLLWRFPVRRLGAEVVRDRILHVSGRLNGEVFGPPIFPPLPDRIEERVKYDNSKWATQFGEEGRKRSIYIYQQRTLNMPLMQVFDAPVCDESRPRRQESTTALQALALYNGLLVNTEVPHFADRIIANADASTESRIRLAFRLSLAREPDDEELSRFARFCDSFEDRREGMISLCRVLYNSSEFLYLD